MLSWVRYYYLGCRFSKHILFFNLSNKYQKSTLSILASVLGYELHINRISLHVNGEKLSSSFWVYALYAVPQNSFMFHTFIFWLHSCNLFVRCGACDISEGWDESGELWVCGLPRFKERSSLSKVRLFSCTFTVQFYMFIHQIMLIIELPGIPY